MSKDSHIRDNSMYGTVACLLLRGKEKMGYTVGPFSKKKLYFLSVLQNVNFGFSAHYYGPYSSFVAEHLNGLVDDGIFKEATEFFTTDSTERNALGEMRRHTYTLTSDADRFWKITEKKPDFGKWDKKLHKINAQKIAHNFNLLSIAAKVHYIVDWNGEKSVKEVCQTAKKYGWDFAEKDIAKVLSFFTSLELVETKKI